MDLGKLKKIELRQAWPHEANDFTRWLALEDNLRALSSEVGFDISLIQTEAAVGGFNVDILAEEAGTGRKIIIENQLEITNHDHLGKVITYAAGHDAGAIIWVVKDVREEHRRAVDWLNEHTDEDTEFYLLRIELWQIADSPFAPKFEMVCKPNDWAKAVKESAGRGEHTETKLKQLEFWDQLKDYAKEAGSLLRFQKSYPQHWTNLSIGSSEAHLSFTINSVEKVLAIELYISDNKELFWDLHPQREAIAQELGAGPNLEWMDLPERKACRIRLSREGDFRDETKRAEFFEWFVKTGEKFKQVFAPRIQGRRGTGSGLNER
ncbi:MAG TPA: DUF4268 domain-containing protein [Candidatus Paceibacterota bacterium]